MENAIKTQSQDEIIELVDMDKDVDYELEEVALVMESEPEVGQVMLDEFLERYREGLAYAARWHSRHSESQGRQDEDRKEKSGKCLP